MDAIERERAENPAATRLCPECGEPAPGRYCGHCGAEQPLDGGGPELPPLRRFVVDAAREVTELDSQLVRTVGALVARPGELTRTWVKGPRRRYLPPLKLFFLANVLYFLAAGFVDVHTFATPLHFQVTSYPGRQLKAQLITSVLRHKKKDAKALEPEWNAVTDANARTLVILMVPLYALAFGALLWWTRRPAVHHVVFATHFMSFYMALLSATCLVVSVLTAMVRARWLRPVSDAEISLVVMGALSLYTYFSVKRGYELGRWAALVVAVGVGLLAFPVLLAYRFLLFFTVWAMI